jgi:glycosyltransferase involved in cell wall biosynthesis
MTSGNPLLSIVLPAYNAAPYLAETVNSIRKQSYRPLEVIVVDDGSTDGTSNIVCTLVSEAESEAEFTLRSIYQANSGPSAARNRGISESNGTYVGFIDADDRWHKDKAAHQVKIMREDPNVGVTFSQWRIITEDGVATNRTGGAPTGFVTVEDLLFENVVGTTSNVIMRREVLNKIGPFDVNLRFCEDLELWLRAAQINDQVLYCLGETLIDRRERPGQLTKNWSDIQDGWLEVIERIKRTTPARLIPIEARIIAAHERYSSFLAYEAGDYSGARKMLLSAWRRTPLFLAQKRRTYPTTVAILATLLPWSIQKWLDVYFRRRIF